MFPSSTEVIAVGHNNQQNIFAQSLEGLTRDGKRDTPAVWSAIKQLALLPAVEQTRLIQLASINKIKDTIGT